jgi:hypothetical protein
MARQQTVIDEVACQMQYFKEEAAQLTLQLALLDSFGRRVLLRLPLRHRSCHARPFAGQWMVNYRELPSSPILCFMKAFCGFHQDAFGRPVEQCQ